MCGGAAATEARTRALAHCVRYSSTADGVSRVQQFSRLPSHFPAPSQHPSASALVAPQIA